MRLGFELVQQQTQKLIMTPELRQAITILQLSAIDLSQFIEEQMLENPLLEVLEEPVDKSEPTDESIAEQVKEDRYDFDWHDYFLAKGDLGNQKRQKEQGEEYSFENFLFQSSTLQEQLLSQFNMVVSNKFDLIIGQFLIGNLDEHGYFRDSLNNTAEAFNTTIEDVERVLKIIQTLEPPGVGARDLKECLLIQVEQLNIENELLKIIIEQHLDDLAEGKLQRIAASTAATLLEVQRATDILKTLNPKPGLHFGNPNDVRYVTPDVILERVEGEYIVLVNDTSVPRLNVSHAYRDILSKGADAETKKFIEGKLNSAFWLIKSIEQRRLTLYKVARAIVDFQRDFLENGIKALKPLNLKQVAEQVGLHESTVSRATANKYIQTPQGTVEFKFFFASGISSHEEGGTSSGSIKKILKDLIIQEDAQKPLSDQKLANVLQNQGIEISRRTVAKYRDEMGILPTTKRKRY